jgi:hypothetical protein
MITIVIFTLAGVGLIWFTCVAIRDYEDERHKREMSKRLEEMYGKHQWKIDNRRMATDPTQGWSIKDELIDALGPNLETYKRRVWMFYCCGEPLGAAFDYPYLPCERCKNSWVTGDWTPLP